MATPSPGYNSPSNLVLTCVSTTSIQLNWIVNTTDETSIEVWRKRDDEPDYTLFVSLPPGTNSYLDSPTSSIHSYSYKLTAVRDEQVRDRVVSLGGYHSLFINNSGLVYACGHNTDGQLGVDPAELSVAGYVILARSEGSPAKNVAAGGFHSLAACNDNTVFAWGYNADGQCGRDHTDPVYSPVQVLGLGGVGFLENVKEVAAGEYHSLALKKDGTVWGWGKNSGFQAGVLGDGSGTNRLTPVQTLGVGGVGYLSNIVDIAAGYDFSLAVDSSGNVYAWGKNNSGQLGQNNIGSGTDSLVPVKVLGVGGGGFLSNIIMVDAPTDTGALKAWSMALDSSGQIFTWGDNQYGQLGDGGTTQRLTPVQVLGENGVGLLSGMNWIAAGSSGFGVASDLDGYVYSWGDNSEGQLGSGTVNNPTSRYYPGKVVGLYAYGFLSSIQQVAAGYVAEIVFISNYAAGWGGNWSWQIGTYPGTSIGYPVREGWDTLILKPIVDGIQSYFCDPETIFCGSNEVESLLLYSWNILASARYNFKSLSRIRVIVGKVSKATISNL